MISLMRWMAASRFNSASSSMGIAGFSVSGKGMICATGRSPRRMVTLSGFYFADQRCELMAVFAQLDLAHGNLPCMDCKPLLPCPR
jgi:hypothetical protein